jgi:hypothetical protein
VPKTFAGGVFQAIETGGPLPRETNVCSNRTISLPSLLHFCIRGLMTEGVQLVVPAPFAIAIGWACGKTPPKYN